MGTCDSHSRRTRGATGVDLGKVGTSRVLKGRPEGVRASQVNGVGSPVSASLVGAFAEVGPLSLVG